MVSIFLENKEDKSNLCGKLILQGEKMVFTQSQNFIGVEDRYLATSPIFFF
jgi:hypothetical protein